MSYIDEMMEYFNASGIMAKSYHDKYVPGLVLCTFSNMPDEYCMFYFTQIDCMAFAESQGEASRLLDSLSDKIKTLANDSSILNSGYVQIATVSIPVPEVIEDTNLYAASMQAQFTFRSIV